MNKQEALQKIKELQEYIEECDKRPDPKKGQLWQHSDGDIYMVCHSVGNFSLQGIIAKDKYDVGNVWSSVAIFGGSKERFTYIGMAHDLLIAPKT
jgi:hypothetical protein